MSGNFCNPQNIDDYWLERPEPAVIENPLPETPQVVTADAVPVRNQFKAIDDAIANEKKKTEGGYKKLASDVKGTAQKGVIVGQGLSQLGQLQQRAGALSNGKNTYGELAKDYSEAMNITNSLGQTLAQGAANMDWLNPQFYATIVEMQNRLAPLTQFTGDVLNVMSQVEGLIDPQTGAISLQGFANLLGSQALQGVINGITEALTSAFGALGLDKFVAGYREAASTFTNKVNSVIDRINTEVDFLLGYVDMADSLLNASAEMIVATCKALPATLRTIRGAWEWIQWLIHNGINLNINLQLPALP